MHVHILSICGKFMSGLAIIAKQLGFKVTGSDANFVEPIYSELLAHEIPVIKGYSPCLVDTLQPDCFIIGNALSRGQPLVENILNRRIPFYSGPAWLAEYVLKERWVLAVAGTHGKTTTTSMLAWILECAGLAPGFLIGGQPNNFKDCARLTASNFFVIEADEYDTAFFDKRSKFMHYSPSSLIINNIEFDHADIFADLAAIQQQFHYLVRLVPNNGLIVAPAADENIKTVLQKGCWTPTELIGDANSFYAKKLCSDASSFEVFYADSRLGEVTWNLLGEHNICNALAAVAAARHVGILPQGAIQALHRFKGVQRRLELKGEIKGIRVYDDFAHHPTAIATTIKGLRAHIGEEHRLIAVLQFGSHTMRAGVHQENIALAFEKADQVLLLRPSNDSWQIDKIITSSPCLTKIYDNVDDILQELMMECRAGDHVLIMSNVGFENIHDRFLHGLMER